MTTSNKLLLGLFLAAVLALAGTQIALYAKYKAGDFESVESMENGLYNIHAIPRTTKLIHITGFDNCSLSHTGEPQVKVQKSSDLDHMSVQFRNDTLFLNADTSFKVGHYEAGLRKNEMVQLMVPQEMPLQLHFSSVSIIGGNTPADTPSYNIQLVRDSRLLTIQRYPAETPAYFGKLNINSTSSEIRLDDYDNVNELNLTAKNSALNINKANIKNSYLDVDDSTNVLVTRKSLQNIHLAPKP